MTALVKYDAACQALAIAKTTDEVKDIRDKAEAMRSYARQAKNKTLEVDAAEIRMRAERRLGELIVRQKETVGLNTGGGDTSGPSLVEGPDAPPTLASAGIGYKLSSTAQKLAAVPEAQFEEKIGEWRDKVADETQRVTTNLLEMGKGYSKATNTGDNEWYTPPEYIDAARDVLGDIDLDPASSPAAQEKIRAHEYFTADNDGLGQDWGGRVWLNPPYAQPLISDFVGKLITEWTAGRVDAAIMLTHNYTDTSWFHKAMQSAEAVCFTRGRIKFYSASGAIAAPTQGQAFFYFGGDAPAFADRFSAIGVVLGKLL